ncbi:MAG TPA: cupin domain-containing protein [Candidatus Paceibacterota bacterium]|jgi:mannose-6-phosphate isomerase-like protein (cupin superfamily)|nr:cupin domain-containing protein [Candidatus Paceibacterota bacterium]
MKGYITNIEEETKKNEDFRHVLYTTHQSQLVLMSIPTGEEIGMEVHGVDQFLRIEAGEGKAILDGIEHKVSDGFSITVPAGTKHNIVNTSSDKPLKLYTVYSPPNHIDGTVHKTKADAEADEEHDHFDGKVSE